MEVVKKAIELINLHGFEVANKICDSMITEFLMIILIILKIDYNIV